jgi:S-adenosylmethionine synthetase
MALSFTNNLLIFKVLIEQVKKSKVQNQGMMFGYATNETENYMPLALDLSHKLLQELAVLRRENNEIRIYVLMLNHK